MAAAAPPPPLAGGRGERERRGPIRPCRAVAGTAPNVTEDLLAGRFRRVVPPDDVDVRAIRGRLGLSQAAFAARFGFQVRTVQEWEQGRRRPEGPARLLLRIIEREPEVVERALADEPAARRGGGSA